MNKIVKLRYEDENIAVISFEDLPYRNCWRPKECFVGQPGVKDRIQRLFSNPEV